MNPPDQAKHNKPSLDANGRLEVIFYDVLIYDTQITGAGGK